MASQARRWQHKLQDLLDKLGWNQADFVRQTELEDLRLTGTPLVLSKHTVSLYLRKNNPRLPKRRQRYIELVDFFAICGAIKTVDEANEWLAMVGHSLTEQEIEELFFVKGILWFEPDDLPPRLLRELRDVIRAHGGSSTSDKDIGIRFPMHDDEE